MTTLFPFVPCPFSLSDLPLSVKISKGLTQAYQVQDFAHAALMAMRENLSKDGKLSLTRDDALAVSHLVRAWHAAQERIRIHRNKPLPGTIRASKSKKANPPRTIIDLEADQEPSPL